MNKIIHSGIGGIQRWTRISALALVLALCLVQPAQAGLLAAPAGQEWRELRSEYFAVIYPAEYELLAQQMVQGYGVLLDGEYERFSKIFGAELELPVTLRVYPTLRDFRNLNPLTPSFAKTATHSHIGFREIALIGENIVADPGWALVGINHIRYELAILFAQKITDFNAPPGLLAGIGWYAQDPEMGSEHADSIQAISSSQPRRLWYQTFMDTGVFTDPTAQVESAALVAWLVERESWPVFLDYLTELATSPGPLEAFQKLYGLSADEAQAQWQVDYADFLAGKWALSIFYEYDLSPLEALVRSGDYAAAESELLAALPVLEAAGQGMNAETASQLLEQARAGLRGGEKALQARQALLDGRYDQVDALCDQAAALFEQAGGFQRLQELDIYRERSARVIELRAEFAALSGQAGLANSAVKLARLAEIGSELASLGDRDGAAEVVSLLNDLQVQRDRQKTWITLGAALIALLLLALRAVLAFRPLPPEVRVR